MFIKGVFGFGSGNDGEFGLGVGGDIGSGYRIIISKDTKYGVDVRVEGSVGLNVGSSVCAGYNREIDGEVVSGYCGEYKL